MQTARSRTVQASANFAKNFARISSNAKNQQFALLK